ncbi:ATP synthase subunit g, mitochondrial [Monosporozyma unispora]|nr:ATP synthase subunit G atp20 [Kazachstania unispora]
MLGRLQSSGLSILTKTQAVATKSASKILYYGKVGKELTLQVYSKEKWMPPNLQTFQKIYCELYKDALRYVNKPCDLVSKYNKLTKDDMVKYGAIGIQLVGFYSVGEMIGRRKLVGYRNYYHPHDVEEEATTSADAH